MKTLFSNIGEALDRNTDDLGDKPWKTIGKYIMLSVAVAGTASRVPDALSAVGDAIMYVGTLAENALYAVLGAAGLGPELGIDPGMASNTFDPTNLG